MSEATQRYVALVKQVLSDDETIDKDDIGEEIVEYIVALFKKKEYKDILAIVEERAIIHSLCEHLDFDIAYPPGSIEYTPKYLVECLWNCGDQKLCEYLLKQEDLCKYLPTKCLADEKHMLRQSEECKHLMKVAVANRKLKILAGYTIEDCLFCVVCDMWTSENQDCCKFVLERKELIAHFSFKQLTDENHAVYKRVWKDCLQLLKIEVYNRKTKLNMHASEWEPTMQRIYRLMG